ncbi:MAG: hypothetical protein ACYCV7_01890 [Acidimicrobiales bacterium]
MSQLENAGRPAEAEVRVRVLDWRVRTARADAPAITTNVSDCFMNLLNMSPQ